MSLRAGAAGLQQRVSGQELQGCNSESQGSSAATVSPRAAAAGCNSDSQGSSRRAATVSFRAAELQQRVAGQQGCNGESQGSNCRAATVSLRAAAAGLPQ